MPVWHTTVEQCHTTFLTYSVTGSIPGATIDQTFSYETNPIALMMTVSDLHLVNAGTYTLTLDVTLDGYPEDSDSIDVTIEVICAADP